MTRIGVIPVFRPTPARGRDDAHAVATVAQVVPERIHCFAHRIAAGHADDGHRFLTRRCAGTARRGRQQRRLLRLLTDGLRRHAAQHQTIDRGGDAAGTGTVRFDQDERELDGIAFDVARFGAAQILATAQIAVQRDRADAIRQELVVARAEVACRQMRSEIDRGA